MPREAEVRVVRELTSRGYNADREAVTLLANAGDLERAVERTIAATPEDALVVDADHVREALSADGSDRGTAPEDPSVSSGATTTDSSDSGGRSPVETEGSRTPQSAGGSASSGSADSGPSAAGNSGSSTAGNSGSSAPGNSGSSAPERSPVRPETANDVTDQSTGTGSYEDFVSVFRDRYRTLGGKLRSRVNHRPAEAIQELSGGTDVAMVGLLNDIRSTASGHWLLELEDQTGVFPCLVMKDREFADLVDELLLDEVLAVEGTLADDGGIVFVDSLQFPDVPRTYDPSTADREVSAALVSDVHVGSTDFVPEAWERFADWLHSPGAADVEYLLICGDMVEGVGVYPDQKEELSIVDVYDQYEAFSERLKQVPGDLEIVMIPGNHDAVRLAEPQPGFDEQLRDIMAVHDPQFTGNPSVVTVEGVDVLMYHGVSLDELIAELPEDKASYEKPHEAMTHLLKKRHLAPQYGDRMRIAPEEQDYLTIDEVPDVFHAGHVHKLGVGSYHGVRVVNSGAWQSQTEFQQSVDLDPDVGVAPILELDTLDVTVRKFI